MIENSHLQTLLAIKENHSFSKAAEALSVTQSAISQSVKSLEQKVGVKLVTRSGKNMALTDEGQKICSLAKNFFKDLDVTLSEIRNEKDNIVGDIRIGTLNGVGKSFIASKMLEFAKMYPDVNVSVTLDFPENLLKNFEKNRLNCLVIPEFMVPDYALSNKLEKEQTILVFPKDHPEFNLRDDMTLKELCEFPVILFEEEGPLFYRWCKKKYRSVPRNLNKKFVVNSFRHIMIAVSEGMGIAVIPYHVYKRTFFKEKISILSEDFKVDNNKFCFAYHQESKGLKKFDVLYDYLKRKVE